MFAHISEELLEAITNVYNEIWNTGIYPVDWKCAVIIPLLKPGKNKETTNSYRPVSLTSCLGKLMERVVNNRLNWRLERYKLLGVNQFGFRPQHGTVDALLYLTEDIYKGFSEQQVTVAVMIDLESAFDTVSPAALMLQCAKIGIRGRLLHYLHSFLTNRTIKVKINNYTSRANSINNGIPQGSVLSPTLFNIMLHDLPSELPLNTKLAIYADDITIWTRCKCENLAAKATQAAINELCKWTNKWHFKVSHLSLIHI